MAARSISHRLSRKGERSIAEEPFLQGATMLPILKEALAHFECKVEARHEGGDHVIFVGREPELERTLNMGVGMVAVVAPEGVATALALLAARGIAAWVVGDVASAEAGVPGAVLHGGYRS